MLANSDQSFHPTLPLQVQGDPVTGGKSKGKKKSKDDDFTWEWEKERLRAITLLDSIAPGQMVLIEVCRGYPLPADTPTLPAPKPRSLRDSASASGL